VAETLPVSKARAINVEVPIDVREVARAKPDRSRLREVAAEFELRAVMKRLDDEFTEDVPERSVDQTLVVDAVEGTPSDLADGPTAIAVAAGTWAASDHPERTSARTDAEGRRMREASRRAPSLVSQLVPAPHTLEVAAMWAVLTRLEEPKKHNLSLMQKLKLYNGKSLPGYTEDNVKELRKETTREGMEGISPRYVQDKISNSLVAELDQRCVNPFMVLNELDAGLRGHSLITSEEQRQRVRELLDDVRREYEEIVKNEVQRAISADVISPRGARRPSA
jgi:hypothetical protein